MTQVSLGEEQLISGQWARAASTFSTALQVQSGVATSYVSVFPVIKEAQYWLLTGEEERGLSALRSVTAQAGARPGEWYYPEAIALLVEHQLLLGSVEETRQLLDPLRSADLTIGSPLVAVWPWHRLLEGSEESAERMLSKAEADAQREDALTILADLLRIKGLLALRRMQWENAAQSFHRAVGYAEAIPYPYARAKALWGYGQLEVARGRPSEARECFRMALRICEDLGERLYAGHIEAALAALDSHLQHDGVAPHLQG
jgi:tetratricopeptide (TPR) repeat protein